MQKIKIGDTGLAVTPLCFGTSGLGNMPDTYGYEVDDARARATVNAIFDGPVNFLDTSNNYGFGRSEERVGAAIRHASAGLALQSRKRRLLLVITDGKPNDLDHYEGRHGIEDTAMAVREARRAGHAVFGVTIDKQAKSWFPRMFGRGGFQVIPHPDRLTQALPEIYRQLVGAA